MDNNKRKIKERKYDFDTISGETLESLYGPSNVDSEFLKNINNPGEYPYTRGIHPNMYRGKLWTMRQFSGFGSPEDTNARYKFFLIVHLFETYNHTDYKMKSYVLSLY